MKKTLLLLGMLLLSSLCLAQVSKQKAIEIVMDSVVGSDSTNVNVYMEPLLQSKTYYVMSPFDSIQSPYANYWLFFIDDMPEYLWYHTCRFVFVSFTNGHFYPVFKQNPPTRLFNYYEEVSLSLDDKAIPVHTNNCYAATPEADINDGKYAVLFCCDNHNYEVFWNSVSHMYCALIEQGYPKENIFVLAHGGDTNTNPKMDLDGDGLPDILPKPCDSANLCAVFDTLTQRMVDSDILYVLAMAHGGRNENQEMEILLWDGQTNGKPFKSASFASLFRGLNCSSITVNIQACYAGYLVDDLLDSIPSNTKYSILPCVGFTDYHRNPQFTFMTGMDVFPFLSCSALRGHYPDSCSLWDTVYQIGSNPYFSTELFTKEERNYDVTWGNNNGLHEIREIIQFCKYDFENFDSIIPLNSYNCGFVEDLLSLRGITGNVTNSQSVNGSFHIEDNFRVTSNAVLELGSGSKFFLFDANLYVEEGSALIMGDSTSIVARSGNCHVYVSGDIEFGDNVSFMAEDGSTLEVSFVNPTTEQIVNNVSFTNCTISSSSHSTLSLSNCQFSNCQINPSGDFSANYCAFTESSIVANTPSYVVSKTALVSNCSFSNLNHVGISLTNYMNYEFSNNAITANNFPGIYVFMCGRYVQATSLIANNTITGCSTGIQAYSSRGTLFDNQVFGNGIGVRFDNISNMSVYGSTTGDGQRIADKSGVEVYVSGNSFPSRFEYNRIVDEDNFGNPNDPLLLYGTGTADSAPMVFDIEHNYWGTNFNPTEDLNPYGSFDYDPVWDGRSANSPERQLYQDAEIALMADKREVADSLYRLVIADYPNSSYAQASMKQLMYAEDMLQNGYDNLKDYYGQITDTTLLALADNLSNKCDEMLGNWANAISWYENVLINPASYEDSVYAVIDLGNLYLGMDSTRGCVGKMQQYRPSSRIEHEENTKRLLETLPRKEAHIAIADRDYPTVTNLSAEIMGNDEVLLTWDFPKGECPEITLSWSDMIITEYTGSQSGQCATDQCQLFDRMDLRGLTGWNLKDISAILSPYDTLFPPLGNYFFRIWKGDDNDLDLVYEHPIDNPMFGVVIAHVIDSLIIVDPDDELRIGYYMDWYADYPWVVDDLPSVDDYKGGRYRYYRDWNPLSECEPVDWANLRMGNLCISSTLTCPDGAEGIAQGITDYRIYRDGLLIKEIPYGFVTYFIDTEFTRGVDVEYCVTAVYEDVESEPVYATVTMTGVNEAGNDGITLSPNPTSGLIRIEGATAAEVRVYNTLGQLVKTAQNTNEVNLRGLPQGVYLLRITDEDGAVATKKLVVK